MVKFNFWIIFINFINTYYFLKISIILSYIVKNPF